MGNYEGGHGQTLWVYYKQHFLYLHDSDVTVHTRVSNYNNTVSKTRDNELSNGHGFESSVRYSKLSESIFGLSQKSENSQSCSENGHNV